MAELKNEKNAYMNKETNEKVIFPRVGAFEIYIYNILVFSKLLSNGWPNHYKIIQILNKITTEKKKGNSIDHFSVFMNTEELVEGREGKKGTKEAKAGKEKEKDPYREKQSIEVYKESSISPSKKKKHYRMYKSKDQGKEKEK